MTKKNVFWFGLISLLILASLFCLAQFKYCDSYGYGQDDYKNFCMNVIDYSETVLEPLSSALFLVPALFLLSLLTYRMRNEVFRAWWNFARWFVPVIIAVTLLLENAGSGGGTLGMDRDFTAFVLIILYSILVLTSFWKIARAYQKLENK